MKKLLLAVVALAAMVCVNSAFAGFAKYVPISVEGFTGNAVENFPVLIRINETKLPGVYDDVKNSGADLKFTDSTGSTEYPYEVDVWDPEGTSLVWVKVPMLNSSLSLRMYYGDASKTTNEDSASVWTGYHGVWHLNADLKDSGENGYDGTDFNTVGATTGPIGTGWTISNSETAGDRVGAIALLGSKGLQQGNTFTWSGWIKTTSEVADEYMCPIAKRPLNCWKNNPAAYDGGFAYLWNCEWTPRGHGFFCSYGHGKGQVNCYNDKKLLNDGAWHYVVICAANGVFNTYYDGVKSLNNQSVSQGVFTNNDNYPVVFGNESSVDSTKIGTAELPVDSTSGIGWQGQGSAWKGSIDEYRLFKTVRSADEVKADYLVATTDIMTFGEPQELSAGSVIFQAEGETSGAAPLRVGFAAFTDGLSGVVTYKWDFNNDGNVDLTTTDDCVTNVFARGVYSVKVTAEDEDGLAASSTIDGYVRVSGAIYVDANATEEGDGTMSAPFKSITNAVAQAIEHETIYLRGGAERKYSIARCDEAAVIGETQVGLTIQGCGADWSLPSGWNDTDNLAVIDLSDTYAADSKTLTGSNTFNAPFVILAENCTIGGIKCEYGKLSFKAQNQGGKGFVNVSADSFTLKNSYLKMKDASGQYDSAGNNGLLYGMTSDATNMKAVGCYIEMGYYRCSLMPLYNGYSGSGLIQCFVKNTATAFSSSAQTQADLYFISNTFYNCKNEDSGYTGWLFDAGANSYPGGGEIAYNLAIHDDGQAKRYRFIQHGRQYSGSWNKEVSIHHNTIVGYDVVFETPHNSNEQRNNTWHPIIFSNLILCPQGTNIVENVASFNAGVAQTWTYRESNKDVEITTSYRPGSEFRCNALLADTFLTGEALTMIPGYDITEGLSYTNTTINLTAAPTFLNTSDPISPDFYRMEGAKGSWIVSGGYDYDGAYPTYIGAVKPYVSTAASGLLIYVR